MESQKLFIKKKTDTPVQTASFPGQPG